MFKNVICTLLVVCIVGLGLNGCGNGDGLDGNDREILRQQRLRLEQQVSNMQQQLATLDRQITELRATQDQQMAQVIASSQAVNQQLQTLRGEITAPNPQTLAPLPNATGDARLPPEVDSTWDVILKFLIALLIVGAFFFLIKFLYGRMHDEEDEDDETEPLDQEYKTGLGTVTVTPAAQAAAGAGGYASPVEPVVPDPVIHADATGIESTQREIAPEVAGRAAAAMTEDTQVTAHPDTLDQPPPLDSAAEARPNDLNVNPENPRGRRRS